ncbi:MAG: hypothetical protein JRN52_14475 [Nitrososphaerota archaeon]|nr:hypothetical protein [Nitrososphaerota archaeon]
MTEDESPSKVLYLLGRFMPKLKLTAKEKNDIIRAYSARLDNLRLLDSLDLSNTAPMSFPPAKRSSK